MAGDLMAADLRTMNWKPSLETRMTELLSSAAAAAAAAGSSMAIYIYMPSHTEKKMDGSGSMGSLDLDFIILDMGTVTPVPCKVTTQHAN